MKVVLVNHSDTLGGASVVSVRLLDALQALGVDARMLVVHKATDRDDIALVGNALSRKAAFLAEHADIYLHNGMSRENLFKVSTGRFGLSIHDHPWVREADVVVLNWINQGMVSLDEIACIKAPVVWTMHDMWPITGVCHHSVECIAYKKQCGNCRLLHGGTSEDDLSRKTWLAKQSLYTRKPIHFVAVSNWLARKCRDSGLLSTDCGEGRPRPVQPVCQQGCASTDWGEGRPRPVQPVCQQGCASTDWGEGRPRPVQPVCQQGCASTDWEEGRPRPVQPVCQQGCASTDWGEGRPRPVQPSLSVIPNAFPVEQFSLTPTMSRSACGLPAAGKLIVMGAARLDDPIKGLELAVEALNKLRDTGATAVFFGGLRDRHALDALRLPYVWLGRISDPKLLRDIYAHADVVLSSSHYETLPGTLVEGMAAGCVPVTFGRGGQADIVDHLRTGYIASYPSSDNLSEGIRYALADRFDPVAIRDSVASRFSAEAVALQYLTLFETLV